MADRPCALPSTLAFDAVGHALFARVTALPDFDAARAELELLRTERESIMEAAGSPAEIVDLRAGTAVAPRPLFEGVRRYVAHERCQPVLDDAVGGLRTAFPRLEVSAVAGDGIAGLAVPTETDEPRLILLLGSALGPLDPTAARLELWRLRTAMRPTDRVLIGMDLDKESYRLRAAYDDAGGVYAAFSRNALRRANREIGTDFCADEWNYVVQPQADMGRVEVRFEARQETFVQGGRLKGGWNFRTGDPLVVEHAYKPSEAHFAATALGAGFQVVRSWTSPARGYGLFLLRV